MNDCLPAAKERGSILIGALLLLTLALSALCLLISAQNHHNMWRHRQSRCREARSQQNRLTRICHNMMEALMQDELVDNQTILDQAYWASFLNLCSRGEDGTQDIQVITKNLQNDPFEPHQVHLQWAVSTRDHDPGMAHRALLQGTYNSGRFPLGTTPMLTASESTQPIAFKSLFSKNTLPGYPEESYSQQTDWFDSLPLLNRAFGATIAQLDWGSIGSLVGQSWQSPPEQGIYPVIKDNDLQALFIYGDIQCMTLSQTINQQKITLAGKGFQSDVVYGVDPSYCSVSGIVLPENCIFKQNIIIIGNIERLEQKGEFGLASFCSLFLYVNGEIHITTSLCSAPSTPSQTERGSITLVSAQKFSDSVSHTANIFIEKPGKALIDGHLISTGTIHQQSDHLQIRGSLSAYDLIGITPAIIHVKPQTPLPLGPEIRFFQNMMFLGFEEIYHDAFE